MYDILRNVKIIWKIYEKMFKKFVHKYPVKSYGKNLLFKSSINRRGVI